MFPIGNIRKKEDQNFLYSYKFISNLYYQIRTCHTQNKHKAMVFTRFSDQCSIVTNNSELPATLKKNKQKKTREFLSTTNFSTGDILNIIRNLDPNKPHRYYMISIRMIKICDTFICRPLKLIFQSCLKSRKFPTE